MAGLRPPDGGGASALHLLVINGGCLVRCVAPPPRPPRGSAGCASWRHRSRLDQMKLNDMLPEQLVTHRHTQQRYICPGSGVFLLASMRVVWCV